MHDLYRSPRLPHSKRRMGGAGKLESDAGLSEEGGDPLDVAGLPRRGEGIRNGLQLMPIPQVELSARRKRPAKCYPYATQ